VSRWVGGEGWATLGHGVIEVVVAEKTVEREVEEGDGEKN
jgi:hypothetical protein